jgi:hypothetical protein
MNDTTWWDGMDGDNLVCRPGNNNDEEFAVACLIVTRITPVLMACAWLCFIYAACLQVQLQRNASAIMPRRQAGLNSFTRRRSSLSLPDDEPPLFIPPKAQLSSHRNDRALRKLVVGFSVVLGHTTMLINGQGTIYASSTVPGMVGDAIRK